MARNIENLKHLRRVVETAPEERLHMHAVVERSTCGTARCALGWCLIDPYFRDNTPLGKYRDHDSISMGSWEGGSFNLYNAALKTFGLTEHAADLLFAGSASSSMDPHAISKQEVLDNVDRAIAGKRLIQYVALRD